MMDKSIRRKVEAATRKKVIGKKVVCLAEVRALKATAGSRVILVVADDEAMRNELKQILVLGGYKVLLAEDGLGLSKVLEASRLDLVLLDVNLPWVDGFELCRLMKGHQGLGDVPLILVSANQSGEGMDRGFEVGSDGYIKRPFDIDSLLNTIDEKASLKERRAPL